MTSYLIRDLTPGRVELLQKAGVTLYAFDQNSHSYLLEGNRLNQALSVLRATGTQEASQFEDVVLLNLEYHAVVEEDLLPIAGTNVIVETNGTALPKPRFLTLIDEVLSPVVGRKIVLHLPHNQAKGKRIRAPFKDDFVHIHVWSSPAGKRKTTPPNTIWGIEVDVRERGYEFTGQGIPIVDEDSEYAVGEIVENNLYIHHCLLSTNSKNEFELLAAILKAAAPDLNLSPDQRRMRGKERHGAGRRKSRQRYIAACDKRIRQLIGEAQKKFDDQASRLIVMRQQAMCLLRLAAFGGEVTDAQERQSEFASEFERLRAVGRVKDVIVSQGTVMVKTETLCGQHPQTGQSHEIGEFLILIDLQCGPHPIRWFNGSRRMDGVRQGMNAPNVFADGTPLVDEIEETLGELVGRLELSVVAELAIQFIETTNDDVPGHHLANWPLALQST